MQKKIIALAVAGLVSGVAFAQNNVTISGTLNGTFGHGGANGATGNNCGQGANEGCSLDGRNLLLDNSSEIRFNGTEDLGGGIKAVWQISSAVGNMFDGRQRDANTANGNAISQTFASRNSKMGLSTPYGEVNYGFWDSPYHQTSLIFEQWGLTVGSNAGSTTGLLSGASGVQSSTVNTSNSVQGNGTAARLYGLNYISPNLSGFQAKIQYVPNETKESSDSGTAANTKFDPRTWSMNATYENGPFSAGVAYEHRRDVSAAQAQYQANHGGTMSAFGVHNNVRVAATGLATQRTAPDAAELSGSKDTFWRLAAKYKFGMGLTLSAGYDHARWSYDGNNNVDNTDVKSYRRNAWMLGATYAFGNHLLAAEYAKANDGSASCFIGTAVCSANSTGAHQWTLGYNYAMSKRTSLYLNYVKVNNDNQGYYDFTVTPVGVAAANRGAEPYFWGAGMRHTF